LFAHSLGPVLCTAVVFDLFSWFSAN
jgi:hypothetical protein